MIRALFLADTHLGFDLPFRPRIVRRRRGHDFFANYQRALNDALALGADFIVHGGDLFYRSRVPPRLVQQAFSPLKRVADAGVPVYLVPGNHERSHIPHAMLGLHPHIHIFHRPQTFVAKLHGLRLALSGFPYVREGVRGKFKQLVAATRWSDTAADVRLLCVHHCFEGATVGPGDYVFRNNSDVVQGADVPSHFAAILSGHIHRHQVLMIDLGGRALPAPVLYPGSIERTSFAEKDESKGYLFIELDANGAAGGVLTHWRFCELPARPMIVKELNATAREGESLESEIRQAIRGSPSDAVLKIRIHGKVASEYRDVLRAERIRSLTPSTMNVDVVMVDERRARWTAGRGA